jgi:hypothetical protein
MRTAARFVLTSMAVLLFATSEVFAVDADLDGLSDAFETATGRDPQQADYVISAGYRLNCALSDNGLACWGDDPRAGTAPGLSHPVDISVSSTHICAIDDNGLQCWGENTHGKTTVPTLVKPTAVSTGWFHNCALDAKGVKCWGDNSKKQLDVPKT